MQPTGLILGGLLVTSFSLATWLEPSFQSWAGSRTQSANVLGVALGDSRKLFARHIYLKADAYFHNGFYPTIYDNNEGFQKPHIKEASGSTPGGEDDTGTSFLGQPHDWIDAWSRHFFPSRHTHLGEADGDHQDCQHAHKEGETCTHEHHDDEENRMEAEREILPWLRFSAELDPQRIETYVVSAYWLRTSMNKVDAAAEFLREGLRANPGNPELLFELGRIYFENRKDLARARNVWEMAQANWPRYEVERPGVENLVQLQITGHLAKLEEEQKNFPRTLDHLTVLKAISPNKDGIQHWIEEVKAKQNAGR